MSRPTRVTIDLNALLHNFQRVREFAPSSAVIAMVKSNAYGHGLERIALALSDADALGVACLEEGRQLRQAGVKNPIVLMEGLFKADEIELAEADDFTLVVHHVGQVELLEKCKIKNPLTIWLKVDTGMHRLGFEPDKTKDAYARLKKCPAVRQPIGLMTHFAESDSPSKALTSKQIELFESVTQGLSGPRSLANSASVIGWPTTHAEWVRPGIMLYGASPFYGHHGAEHGLQPVMSFTSELIAVHLLKKGDRVGYGGAWTCPEDMRIGVVAVGYGDGYPRHAENGTPVFVNNELCPLVGRVSMDMITVDLRTQPNAQIGDPVVLWGGRLPVELVAKHSNTIGYELLTRITQRVHVVVKGDLFNH